MNKEEIKSKYFSCIYCLTPFIEYEQTNNPLILNTKCFNGHEIKYNIDDFISFRKEQFIHLENITCDKCQSKKNLSFCNEEKSLLCQKCFGKFHKDKNHIIQNLNKIDNCPKHNKNNFYCNECKIIFCKDCSSHHFKSHKFSAVKDFLLSEDEKEKLIYIINKLEQMNYVLNYKIFNSNSKPFNYTENIDSLKYYYIHAYQMNFKEDITN